MSYIANGAFAIGLIGYLAFSDAARFSNDIALFVLITLVGLIGFWVKSRKKSEPVSFASFAAIFIVGTVATAIFWFRAWAGVPATWMASFSLDLLVFAFWWPGVLYAVIFRHPGEGIVPSSRKRFFQNAGVGFLAGLVGLIAAYMYYENHLDAAAEAQLFYSIEEIENNLPAGVELHQQLRDDTVYLSYTWAGSIGATNYEALRTIRQLNAATSRLVDIRLPRRVVVDMSIGDNRFAHLDWGPGRRGNPWYSLELDVVAAGADSLPNQSDIAVIAEEAQMTGFPNDFQVEMDEQQLTIRWAGDDNILDTAAGVLKMAEYWNFTSSLITEVQRHFTGIEGYNLQFPGYELRLTSQQTYRTNFYAQRFLANENTVFLGIGGIYDDWEKPSELSAPVNVVRYESDFQRHSFAEVWPFMPQRINGHTLVLIDADDEGIISFIAAPEEDLSRAEGPFVLNPGESIEAFGIRIENLGGTVISEQ